MMEKIASNKKDENYCVDIRPVSFETDSWDTIIKAFRDNDYPYKVGDTRSIDLGTLGNHKLRIANTSECVNNEKSETACGIVLEFEDIILNRSMNTTWENKGGWASSNTRDYVNNEVYNSLEEDLKKIIIDTKVISSHGSIDSKNFESTDKLYLFSCQEVYGTSYTSSTDSSNGTSRQLDYYKNKGVTTSTNTGVAAKKYNGSSTIYWLRSATSYASGSFLTINGGSIVTYIPSESHGVSPAFRIG